MSVATQMGVSGGLTYPVTFTQGQPSPKVTCWSSVVISGGKFTAPFGGKLTCS